MGIPRSENLARINDAKTQELADTYRCPAATGGAKKSVSSLPYRRLTYLQIPSLRWDWRLHVRHGQIYREMETAETSCPGCVCLKQKTLPWA